MSRRYWFSVFSYFWQSFYTSTLSHRTRTLMQHILNVKKCVVCKHRPQAFSTTGMCYQCINKLYHPDLMEVSKEIEFFYGLGNDASS